jgi:hypothetical protein
MGTDWDVIDRATTDLVPGRSADASERANSVNTCFVFFVEPGIRQLHALHRRSDGNYGLVAPAG